MLSVVAAVLLAAWEGSTWSARSSARTYDVDRDERWGNVKATEGRTGGRWWGADVGLGTTRRRRVGRPTATLIFAGRNRTAGMRSRVPLTRCAPGRPAHSAPGDRCCSGGAAARRGLVGETGRADRRPA